MYVSVRYWGRLGKVKFILDVLRWEKKETSAHDTPIRPLLGDSAHLAQKQLESQLKSILFGDP